MKTVISNDPVRRRISWNGIPIDIEWPKGSTREYRDEGGEVTFSTLMNCDYGYIRGTDSVDGEEIDCYVGGEVQSPAIFIVDQLVTEDSEESLAKGLEPGDHDEWKYMLGFADEDEASGMYVKQMTPEHFGGIYEMPFEEFRAMVKQEQKDAT
jgi:inorganic pyrophosphatase